MQGDENDKDSVSRSGRSSGEGNDNPLQYSCLKNSMDREVWWATVHRVAKNSDMTEVTQHACKEAVALHISKYL